MVSTTLDWADPRNLIVVGISVLPGASIRGLDVPCLLRAQAANLSVGKRVRVSLELVEE